MKTKTLILVLSYAFAAIAVAVGFVATDLLTDYLKSYFVILPYADFIYWVIFGIIFVFEFLSMIAILGEIIIYREYREKKDDGVV